MTSLDSIAHAQAIANQVRALGDDDTARLIEAKIEEFRSGQRDGLSIGVGMTIKVEKFDGEYRPGAKPVETIVRTELK